MSAAATAIGSTAAMDFHSWCNGRLPRLIFNQSGLIQSEHEIILIWNESK